MTLQGTPWRWDTATGRQLHPQLLKAGSTLQGRQVDTAGGRASCLLFLEGGQGDHILPLPGCSFFRENTQLWDSVSESPKLSITCLGPTPSAPGA